MIQVVSRSGVVPLAGKPEVRESALELRGIAPTSTVEIGGHTFTPDPSGSVRVRLHDHEHLRGHVGLVAIWIDGEFVGEVHVTPDKMSQPAFDSLRIELQALWRQLILEPDSTSSLSAGLPPADDLLRRIERSVHDVAREPRELLEAQPAVRHLRQCRRASELTPNLIRRANVGMPTEVRVPTRVVSPAEAALVSDTLERLQRLAITQHDPMTAQRVASISRNLPWSSDRRASRHLTRVPWGARSDARYRRIYAVWQLLQRPDLEPTVGPGELRLGVKALPRLFEYWIFLQVIKCAEATYGSPLTDLTSVLSESVGEHGRLLELAPGTEVEFPGGVVVAFEPAIYSSGRSWRQIEYVPHPDRRHSQTLATPDVVVFRTGPNPEAVVIDAKYVGRGYVDESAAEIHIKYARMRINGQPIVTNVIAVHPHLDRGFQWAGYADVGVAPGGQPLSLRLPEPNRVAAPIVTPHSAVAAQQPSPTEEVMRLVGLAPELAVHVLDAVGGVQPAARSWPLITIAVLRSVFTGPLRTILDEDERATVAEIGQFLKFISEVIPTLGPRPNPLGDFLETLLAEHYTSLRVRLCGTRNNSALGIERF